MYQHFYQLKEKPFSIVPSSENLFLSSKHSQALTHLEYGIQENIGFLLLSGDIGTGKTSLIQHMLKICAQEMEVAMIFNTNTSPEELIKLILAELEINPISDDKSINLDKLNTFLIDQYARNKRVLLIIDEAQNLSWAALEEVRMLSNLHAETAPLLQVILVGQPELRQTIHEPRLEQLAQRIAVAYHLGPLNAEETKAYIQHRLSEAGSENIDLFENEAIDLVFEQTKGIPRSINLLCDASLVYGYAEDSPSISQEIVNQVIADRQDFKPPEKQSIHQESTGTYSNAGDENLELRIRDLEHQMERLQEQLAHQQRQIHSELEDSRKSLIQKMEKQLQEARKKNEKLLIFYGQHKDRVQKNIQTTNNGTEQSASMEKDFDSLKQNNNNQSLIHPSISTLDVSPEHENSLFSNNKIRYIAFGVVTFIILLLTVVHISIQPLQTILP